MTAKKEDLKKEEERRAAAKDIEHVNEKMSAKVKAVAESYSELVAGRVSGDPMKIASRLAKQFPALKFTIEVDRGDYCYANIHATPEFKPFVLLESEHYPEARAKDALAVLAKIDTHFPSFEIVQAYARGVESAAATERELADLKKKYEDLKEKVSDSRGYGYGYGPPCMMMMRGFGR